jgi:hypothetical protein
LLGFFVALADDFHAPAWKSSWFAHGVYVISIPVCMSCCLLLSAGGRWLVAWLGLESYVECINETVLACVLIG